MKLVPCSIDWPGARQQVIPYLERALAKQQRPDWDLPGVLRNVESAQWTLYGVVEGETVIGAGVLAVQQFGLRRVLEVVFYAADEHTETWETLLSDLADLARTWGCSAIRCEGRPGWERVLGMQKLNIMEVPV